MCFPYKNKNNNWILSNNKAQEENEAREMSIIYGCQDGLVAMHNAGLTLTAAMATLIQVRSTTIPLSV